MMLFRCRGDRRYDVGCHCLKYGQLGVASLVSLLSGHRVMAVEGWVSGEVTIGSASIPDPVLINDSAAGGFAHQQYAP